MNKSLNKVKNQDKYIRVLGSARAIRPEILNYNSSACAKDFLIYEIFMRLIKLLYTGG